MADLTIAASEQTFVTLFEHIRDNFRVIESDSGDFGAFTASYSLEAHLEGGSVDLRSDNTVRIKELDIKWDDLSLTLGIDIDELCIGGFCIIPNIIGGGCAVRAPDVCLFSEDPDINVPVSLGDLITSEVSLTGSLRTNYEVNPARPAGMNAWVAQGQDPSLANHWQLFIDPQVVDVDVFDIADIVGDLLEDAVDAAINNFLAQLSDPWVRNFARELLGSAIDLIRNILDIPDDIEEWISDLLNRSFGMIDRILQLIAEYFAIISPIHQIEDPYPILGSANNPNSGSLPNIVPVKIPIRDLNVFNDDQEMVLEANVGVSP